MAETETETKHFTEIRMFETADTWVNYTVCLDCGACVFVDEADRKEDIHPISIHLKFHEELDKKLGAVQEILELLSGATPTSMAENLPEPLEARNDESKPKPFPGRSDVRPTPNAPRTAAPKP